MIKIDNFIEEDQIKIYKDNSCQTIDTAPRQSVLQSYKMKPIKEFVNESEDGYSEESEEFDTGANDFQREVKEALNQKRGNRHRQAQSYANIPFVRKISNVSDNMELEMNFEVTKEMYKRKKATSVTKNKNWYSPPQNNGAADLIKVFEENIKLEEKIQEMTKFSQENIKLKEELSNAKHKMSEHEQKITREKDDQIIQLAQNLEERENRYRNLANEFNELKRKLSKSDKKDFDSMLEEKELELEKINHMNASYRAQLIEMKISMSKNRDIGRFNNDKEDHVIGLESEEVKLEEAKDKIINLEDKGKSYSYVFLIFIV